MTEESRRSRVVVLGTGRMGRGIGLSFAFSGYPVHLVDSEERSAGGYDQLAQDVWQEIETELQLLQRIKLISARQAADIAQRIELCSRQDAAAPLAKADFVFEAVAEVLDIKREVYTWLNPLLKRGAIIGSTTSTMLVDTLAEFVADSSRFLNTHWLNPALLMPLVEVSPGRHCSEKTVSCMKYLLQRLGKEPVLCAASPGFIVPRIQALAMTEAARCVEEGVASAEDVDKAVRLGFGVRFAILGMLEFIDWGGGDIVYHATRYLADSLDERRFSVPEVIENNMRENRNGIRDGRGFYDYRDRDLDSYRQERLGSFVGLLQHLKLLPEAK